MPKYSKDPEAEEEEEEEEREFLGKDPVPAEEQETAEAKSVDEITKRAEAGQRKREIEHPGEPLGDPALERQNAQVWSTLSDETEVAHRTWGELKQSAMQPDYQQQDWFVSNTFFI